MSAHNLTNEEVADIRAALLIASLSCSDAMKLENSFSNRETLDKSRWRYLKLAEKLGAN